ERTADGKVLVPRDVPDPVRHLADGVQLVRAPALLRPENKQLGEVTIGIAVAPWEQALRRRCVLLFAQYVGSSVLLAVRLAELLRRMVGRPLQRLDLAARSIGAGDLDQRVALEATDEFGRLAATLEQMRGNLKASYAAMAEQNVQLKEFDRLKDQFLANMSHEIRTPLTSILGNVELLQHPDAEQREKCMDSLRRNSHHLLCLVNQVLDFSKLQAGSLCLD